MPTKTIRTGGASGYCGDYSLGTAQLLATDGVDYLVYDYLAEITMSIMARARAADSQQGFAVDFVTTALKPNLRELARQGVKVISNAGAINCRACADAVKKLVEEAHLDLKVAVVEGDDLHAKRALFAGRNVVEMFSGEAFPPVESIASINAYLGAFPIARALESKCCAARKARSSERTPPLGLVNL